MNLGFKGYSQEQDAKTLCNAIIEFDENTALPADRIGAASDFDHCNSSTYRQVAFAHIARKRRLKADDEPNAETNSDDDSDMDADDGEEEGE